MTDKQREYQRQYREKNKEILALKRKEYRLQWIDYFRKIEKEARIRNKLNGKVKTNRSEYQKEYYQKNKEEIKFKNKKYYCKRKKEGEDEG